VVLRHPRRYDAERSPDSEPFTIDESLAFACGNARDLRGIQRWEGMPAPARDTEHLCEDRDESVRGGSGASRRPHAAGRVEAVATRTLRAEESERVGGGRVSQARPVRSVPAKPLVLTVVACLAALASALLPWLKTGEARRSAFALARSADALGFIDSPLRRALVVSWYLLPFLTAAAWTAAVLRKPVVAAGLGAVVGSMSVAAGSMFMSVARPGVGSVASVVAGSVALAGAGWLAWSVSSARPATAGLPQEGSSQ
jgi:hypothetical protein